ncbi:hypothetical protein AVEN_129240-1, partial [Araneus ventricosus]
GYGKEKARNMTHSPVPRIAAVNPDRQFDHGFAQPTPPIRTRDLRQ